MGVAIKTYLDQKSNEDNEYKDIESIARAFFPKATHFKEDVEIFREFFDALVKGVRTLGDDINKDVWVKANDYLQALA